MWDPNLENNVDPRDHFVYECQSWGITESPKETSVFQDAYSTRVTSHRLSRASSLYLPEQWVSTTQLKLQAGTGWMHFANRVGSWKHAEIQKYWHFAGQEFANALASSKSIHSKSLRGLVVYRERKEKRKELPHRLAVAWESQILVSLSLRSLFGIFLSPCLCTKCQHLCCSQVPCCVDLRGIRSLLQALVSPVLSSSFWAATRSSKRVAAAEMWNRNQTSEPQVHTVYKTSFSPSASPYSSSSLCQMKATAS